MKRASWVEGPPGVEASPGEPRPSPPFPAATHPGASLGPTFTARAGGGPKVDIVQLQDGAARVTAPGSRLTNGGVSGSPARRVFPAPSPPRN